MCSRPEPHSTGWIMPASVCSRISCRTVAGGDVLAFEVRPSDQVLVVVLRQHVEQLLALRLAPRPACSAGIGSARESSCRSSPASKYSAFIVDQVDDAARTASWLSLIEPAADGDGRSAPAGLRAARGSRRAALAKLAPTTSILLTNTSRGTSYLSACRQTVSDCASTPFWASKTTTRRRARAGLRSTSAVKSTWPGVSIRLIGAVAPLERDAGAVDGDAAFLLLGVVVGLGGALIDAAELVLGPGVVEQVLGGGRLAGVDVGDDADVADLAQVGVGVAAAMTISSQASAISESQRSRMSKTKEVSGPCQPRHVALASDR